MSAPRFFLEATLSRGAVVLLEPDDAHHAAHVLRMTANDRLVLTNQSGAWDAEISGIDANGVRVRVLGEAADRGAELPVAVTVLQAIGKGAKFDEVVEKCVELGARHVVPVRCARSYADATPTRIERWRRIARAAAMQSRRSVLPTIGEPMSWSEALAALRSPLLLAWERAPRGSLRAALDELAKATAFAIAVGPEGSFTDEEIDAAVAAGARAVSLGPTILRTETAAAALLAAIASSIAW